MKNLLILRPKQVFSFLLSFIILTSKSYIEIDPILIGLVFKSLLSKTLRLKNLTAGPKK